MESTNTEQFTRLWTKAHPDVCALLFMLVRDFHLAEDLLQEVAVVALREFGKYDPARPFLPWVLAIARNTALMSMRVRKKLPNALFDEALFADVQSAFQRNSDTLEPMRSALRLCLEKQKNRMYQVLEWRYFHDLKPQDIAARMETTSGAIRVLLHRARNALRDCIRRQLEAV